MTAAEEAEAAAELLPLRYASATNFSTSARVKWGVAYGIEGTGAVSFGGNGMWIPGVETGVWGRQYGVLKSKGPSARQGSKSANDVYRRFQNQPIHLRICDRISPRAE